MIEIKLIPDMISFGYRIAFFKDDVKLTSFNYEILDDLTFISPNGKPFKGTEFSLNNAILELSHMIKNECPEELENISVEEIMEKFKPIVEHYKIKKWDGEYLPFR